MNIFEKLFKTNTDVEPPEVQMVIDEVIKTKPQPIELDPSPSNVERYSAIKETAMRNFLEKEYHSLLEEFVYGKDVMEDTAKAAKHFKDRADGMVEGSRVKELSMTNADPEKIKTFHTQENVDVLKNLYPKAAVHLKDVQDSRGDVRHMKIVFGTFSQPTTYEIVDRLVAVAMEES